ncbi:MAG: ribonuclease HII [Alphaproteobacteria bacterium]|nr:ribonuclease HII [Alphaproteobacteria bacterium]
MPGFAHERKISGVVAGIDEAGRGPLAGPVVAACVVLDEARTKRKLRSAIDDSKKLSREERETAFELLLEARADGIAAIGVAAASVTEIDRINILQASLLAMRRALARLPLRPDHVLIDGDRIPHGLPCAATAIVGGDARCISIAAASIVAKVLRDRAMTRLALRYPGFGWDTNVGYGTEQHTQGLARLGPCRHHRLSFAPCAQFVLSL